MGRKPLQIKNKDKLQVTCEQEQTECITKYFGNLLEPNKDVQSKRYAKQNLWNVSIKKYAVP